MKEKLFTYVYRGALGVMVFSGALMFFVQSTAPFGLTASWSEQGVGSPLVVTYPLATATLGDKVVASAELQNKVTLFRVEEILRRDGGMYYRVSEVGAPAVHELVTFPAIELNRGALATIPFAGVFVRMLVHPVGGMALIGLPLLMLLINYGLLVMQKLIPALRVFEGQQTEAEGQSGIVYAEEVKNEMVTVLKPYKLERS